jgi:hypothetical protein
MVEHFLLEKFLLTWTICIGLDIRICHSERGAKRRVEEPLPVTKNVVYTVNRINL